MQSTTPTTNDQPDYSIVVRFGSAVLEAGHTSIPNLVLLHYAQLGVTTGELVFMTLCLQLKWSKGNPHPSLATIAERMGVSRRQVRTYAAGLKAKGLLRVEERVDSERGQLSSVYDFTPLLEAVVRLDDGNPGDAGAGEPASRAGNAIPPGKDSSEGGRKFSSEGPGKDPSALREDEIQEDTGSQSSRFTTLRRKSALTPAMPAILATPATRPQSAVAVSAPADQTRRDPQSLAEIVRSRMRPPVAEIDPEIAPSERSQGRYEERPYLDSLIRGVSQIFNDDDNTDANIVRAHRLQERSGLDEDTFTQCVFRARSLVKERRLRHRGVSVRRPGAYFFTILEDLANEARSQDSAQNRPVPASEPRRVDVGHPVAKRAL